VTASNIDSHHRLEVAGAAAIVDWDFAGGTLTSITAYRDAEIDTLQDVDGTTAPYMVTGRDDTDEQLSQEIRFASGTDGPLEWIVGGYFLDDESSQNVLIDVAGLIVSQDPLILFPIVAHLGGEVDTTSYAAFANATWKWDESFKLNGGVRYTYDEKEMTEFSRFGALRLGADEKDWDKVTYSVGGQYFLVEKTMLFATASTGFKSGGFNAGGFSPSFDPETAVNFEVGIKSRFLDDRAELAATAFHTDYEDLQVQRLENLTIFIQNAAEARLRGLELEGVLLFTDSFRLRGAFAYLDATFESFTNTDPANPSLGVQDLSGNTLSNAPEYTYSLAPEFVHSLGNLGVFSLYGAYYWQDRVYFEVFNKKKFSQESVGRIDIGASLKSPEGTWEFIAFAKNVTDEEVMNNVFVASCSVGCFATANLSAARTYGARLQFNF
jgi:iron complex outermembrane receptor protein